MKLIIRGKKNISEAAPPATFMDLACARKKDKKAGAGMEYCIKNSTIYDYYLVEKIGFEPMKIVKKLLIDSDEFVELMVESGASSYVAYLYCLNIADREEVWRNITDSFYAYFYCRYVADREEVWRNITDSFYACLYCSDVADREEVWRMITDSHDAYRYCSDVADREEVWRKITDSEYAYRYCRDVADREDIRRLIKDIK
jgi:outer membrane protein assembly factor BamB